jgi:hypothetical protein
LQLWHWIYNLNLGNARRSRKDSKIPLERHGPHWARVFVKHTVPYDGADDVVGDLSGIYGNAAAHELTFRIHSRVTSLH